MKLFRESPRGHGTRRSRCGRQLMKLGALLHGPTLTLIGFVLLTVGGWLGGAIVFVHGMRVETRT